MGRLGGVSLSRGVNLRAPRDIKTGHSGAVMRLTQFSLQNPPAIAAAGLIVLLFGGLSLYKLPIQLLPDTRQPQLFINVGWREAAPNEVEEALITPIEKAMRGLPGLTEMRSNSAHGFGGVNLIFQVGTDMTRVML